MGRNEKTPAGGFSADFLLALLDGIEIPQYIEIGEFRDVEIPVRDGWKIEVFYDGGDLDYINHFVTPEGVIVDFWDWPDSPDKDALIAWRGQE